MATLITLVIRSDKVVSFTNNAGTMRTIGTSRNLTVEDVD